MAENEVVFRRRNEHIQERFEELKKIAVEDGQEQFVRDIDVPLQFFCECSDENCRQRIPVKPDVYNELHAYRDRFIVVPGHETKQIERIIRTEPEYYVVEKFQMPSGSADTLLPTELDNA